MSENFYRLQDYDPRVRYTRYFQTASVNLFLAQNGVLNRYSFRNSYWYSAHGRPATTNRFSRKAILERGRSQSPIDTKRRRATAFGCPETPFFRPQSTALHPVELLASKWCMVSTNGHLAKLLPHQVISDDEFHVTKVLKPSLLSIFKSLCINLLTGLRASLLVQHVHFQQSRERQNTGQRES